MILFFFLSCFLHKTSLKGIIDHTGHDSCAIELETGQLIVIESSVCKGSSEGQAIKFYVRKK
jgi:hypothetical protein